MTGKGSQSIIAMNCIIMLLGLVLITEGFGFLFSDDSSTSWINYLERLKQFMPLHSYRSEAIIFLQNTAPYSQMVFVVCLFLSALACIGLFARFYTCLLVSLGFFIVWALNWQAPEIWSYAFLFPALFALLASLGTRHLSLGPQAIFSQLGFSFITKVLVIGIISACLYYVTHIAFNQGIYADKVAIFSALSFFFLGLALNGLSYQALEKDPDRIIPRYFDYMILVLASMLVMQVYANYFSGLFETDFKKSLSEFAAASNAYWIRGMLRLSAEYSSWILPPYILFESSLCLCLSLLLFPVPVLLMLGTLLFILAFAEIGVSGIVATSRENLNWEWQLLIPVIVTYIICIDSALRLKGHLTLKNFILGDSLSKENIPFFKALIVAVLSGLGLYFICMVTQIFGASYRSTAVFAGISFGVLMLISLMMDRFRAH